MVRIPKYTKKGAHLVSNLTRKPSPDSIHSECLAVSIVKRRESVRSAHKLDIPVQFGYIFHVVFSERFHFICKH